jgi:carbon monoxide dehydrogenase subunit G
LHLEGSFETIAARATVWEFLLNPTEIAPCFPDLQSLEVDSPDKFRAKVKVGLSIVSGMMDFAFQTTEQDLKSFAKLVGTGKGVGSTIEIQTSFSLADSGSGTKLAWVADVKVGGVMAGLGSKLLDSTSSKMVTQVIENIKTKLDEKES